MRRRFFVDHFTGNSAALEGDAAHHLGQVLRAQIGHLYELSDGSTGWLARVESVSRSRVEFSLLEKLPATQLAADITLLLSITKFDAFEWALEKATELGVAKVVPLAAARSEKHLIAAAAKRAERWRKILFESSQQSRRLRLPQLTEVSTASAAFSAREEKLRLIFSERQDAPLLKHIFAEQGALGGSGVAVAIGPEGGWTDEEFAVARSADFYEASLGPLILRAETAAMASLAILNFWVSAD